MLRIAEETIDAPFPGSASRFGSYSKPLRDDPRGFMDAKDFLKHGTWIDEVYLETGEVDPFLFELVEDQRTHVLPFIDSSNTSA